MTPNAEEVEDFNAEDLPKINQPAWTIEVKAGLEHLDLSATDSEDDCGSNLELFDGT